MFFIWMYATQPWEEIDLALLSFTIIAIKSLFESAFMFEVPWEGALKE